MNTIDFDDYYEELQLSPNADQKTIERVYRLIAKSCHPDNQKTGDFTKFEALNTAYQILSNPQKRAKYDATYEEKRAYKWRIISELNPSEGYQQDLHNRRCLLSLLYIKCREDPSDSGIGPLHLEKILGWPENVIQFHIWYLREKDYIRRNENGLFEITATGVDKIEEDGLVLGKDRLIPEKTKTNSHVKLIQHGKQY